MATVPLSRSEEQFWDMSLRTLISLIKQHEKLERERAKAIGYMTAMFMNGRDPDEGMIDVTPKKIRKKELQMGNAMW